MRQDLDNSADIIDSRDVIERIAELESERADLVQAIFDVTDSEGDDTALTDANDALSDWDEANGAELKALKELAEETNGYVPDWTHGATLIRHSYFVDYCQEMLQDIGDLPRDLPGYLVIDWEATANNLKVDYTTVDFDGVEYYVR